MRTALVGVAVVAAACGGNGTKPDGGGAGVDGSVAAAVVTTLAGSPGVAGSTDGTSAAARFDAPRGIAVDSAGTIYVADTINDTIRAVTRGGVVTTLAGSPGEQGSADGTGSAARFDQPIALAVDVDGNVYVADSANTIRKITASGVVTTLAGNPGVSGSTDGTGSAARFAQPAGVAVDRDDNLYVGDSLSCTIRKVTPAGVVTTIAGSPPCEGFGMDGTGSGALFDLPTGVALDGAGNVYVADTGENAIRKITPDGVVTTLAGVIGMFCEAGSTNGSGAAARFDTPTGITVDGANNLYVADTENDTIRRITPDGVVTTLAGLPGVTGAIDGTAAIAQFDDPSGVAVDGAGNVYVADAGNDTVRLIAP